MRLREFGTLAEPMSEHPLALGLVLTATSTGLSQAQAKVPKRFTLRTA